MELNYRDYTTQQMNLILNHQNYHISTCRKPKKVQYVFTTRPTSSWRQGITIQRGFRRSHRATRENGSSLSCSQKTGESSSSTLPASTRHRNRWVIVRRRYTWIHSNMLGVMEVQSDLGLSGHVGTGTYPDNRLVWIWELCLNTASSVGFILQVTMYSLIAIVFVTHYRPYKKGIEWNKTEIHPLYYCFE